MSRLPVEPSRPFLALAPYADIAAELCDAAASGRWLGMRELREICSACGLSLSQQGNMELALHASAEVGLVRQISALTWQVIANTEALRELGLMLRGTALYWTVGPPRWERSRGCAYQTAEADPSWAKL